MDSSWHFHRELVLIAAVGLLSACSSSGSGTPATGGTTSSGGSAGLAGSAGAAQGGTGASGGSAGAGAVGGTGGALGGASGAAGQSGAAGSGGGTAIDYTNCKTSDECPGGSCQPLIATVAGYQKASPIGACTYPIEEATACLGSPLDECCISADCTSGKCVKFPPNPECPDPSPPTPHNVCTQNNCACSYTTSYCIPAGAWGYKESACLQGHCWQDSTCEGYEPGSKCLPVFDPCGKALAIACVPPVIGCQRQSDCPAGKVC
jgi:hypothetical protein